MAQSEQDMFKNTVDNIGNYIWKQHCEPNLENVMRYYRAKVTGAPSGGKVTIQVPYEQNSRQVKCSATAASSLSVGDQCLVLVFGDASNAICTGKVDLSDTGGGGGGGGTTDYTDLSNKPQINGVTLSGNKTSAQLDINVPSASAATPIVDGTGSAGSSAAYARGDHIHPTDTTRAPLASPTFTGTPAAPTASTGTNTTQLATTAFVQQEIAAAITDAIGGSY